MTTEVTQSSSESSASTTSAAPSEAPATQSTGSVSPSTETASISGASSTTGTPAPVVPAPYAANYKFKVMDKEHEIPEFLRSAIKDADTEKQLRELHEKAYGLDVVKPKYQSVKSQYDQVAKEKAAQDRSLATLGKFVENNDFDSFFKALKISEEQVLQYALERLNYRQLTPEQRMQFDAQTNERQRLTHLEMQNQMLQEQFMNESVQTRTIQLENSLAKPEIKGIAEMFDARVGKQGAFRSEVIKRGQYAHYTTGADISVEQAVSEVMQTFSPLLQGAASAPQVAAQTGAVAPPAAPPVIPNVAGRATSPAKRVVKSLAEMRELSKAL